MSLWTARVYYLATVGVLAIFYYAMPSVRPVASALIGAAAVAAIASGIVRLRPQRWAGWALVALAVVMTTAGDALFATLVEQGRVTDRYPETPDIFFLLACPLLAIGLIVLGRPALPSRDLGMLLDIIGLSLAGSLLVWITLVRPALVDEDLTGVGEAVALASWVGFVAVLATGARVVLDWYRIAALRWLTAGVLAFLIAGSLYAEALLRNTERTGGLVDIGFHTFAVCCGIAALTPSMARVASHRDAQRQKTVARIALLAVSTLVAPTALLFEATHGSVTAGIAIAIVSAGVGIVAVTRLALSLNDHRRRTAREDAVRIASRQLVAATTEDEVVACVKTALGSMLVTSARHDVRLVTGSAEQIPAGPTGQIDSGDSRLTIPLPIETPLTGTQRGPVLRRPAGRALQFTAPAVDLVELVPSLEAISDQAASALARIALVWQLRADERERYFRTLVLTSRDVTLISRAGRIDYATPSALDMFGRDIRGDRVQNVVLTPSAADEPLQRMLAGDDGMRGDGKEGYVRRPDGSMLTVLVRERDLTADPTVSGVVTTLRDVTAERMLQQDLAYRASHDPLTGLANAEAFQIRLNEIPSGRDAQSRAALFVDLDDFKMINDTYGHDVGDRLLEIAARRIESCLRADDLAARLGGDEFAVLLDRVPGEEAARAVAQRIADALAEPAIIDGVGLSCQASIGLAYGPAVSTSLLQEADAALYTAKERGKGRWTQFRQGMSTPTRRHANARQRIERAMAADTLELHYQPIVALATNEVVGFEALVRLRDGEYPMTPQEIIRVADDTGLINQLGAWTLRRALRDLRQVNPLPGPQRYVSVNVSARQLRQPDFVDVVRAAVADADADPGNLVLEIVEEPSVGDEYDRAWTFLAELRKDGIRIAIDDYGTGYASLSYLRQPGIDVVKIDQSFVAAAAQERGRTLLRALTALCQELGLGMIAEGITDTTLRDLLIEFGCHWGQGYLYAPAMPIDEAIAWHYVP